ncbi:MAG: Gfo/Idh/MocA family oxidoreductase [Gammaproteobacteria bacterium]|nr:Gfo/Idh/MocA family oxidoreductase [Gammaproteobacteria bacterium]
MQANEATIRWGIIGCGDVCEVKSGPAFSKVPNSTLHAVMRRDADLAADFARRHGVPAYYADARQLIADPDVNAIYVATPPASHEEYALLAIAAGKPVYIEKPLSVDAPSTRRILQAAQSSGVKASGAYYRRRLPLFEQVKEFIEQGRLGRIRHISIRLLLPAEQNGIAQTASNWRIDPRYSGGGLFHDLAPHMLDILCWLFGKPLSCRGRALNQAQAYAAPDFTSVEALFADDIFFNGVWSFNAHSLSREDTCTIYGDKGNLSFAFFARDPLRINTEAQQESIQFQTPQHIQQPMIHAVVRYFRGEAANPCSLSDALLSMDMMDSVEP